MKNIISFLSLLFILFVYSLTTSACPAYPGIIHFQQPNNGAKVDIYLKGDERVHWAESTDGYTLLYDDEGYLCYAQLMEDGSIMPSIHRATAPTNRSAEVSSFLANTPKYLHYSRRQIDDYLAAWQQIYPETSNASKDVRLVGERRSLVVLFQTPDCEFRFRKSSIVMLFNQENYTEDGAHGSVSDYYYNASNHQFRLHVDVLGPITGDHEMAYYGSEQSEGYYTFAREVVTKIEGMADFSQYDNDGDGVVDGFHILFAGFGEESGGSESLIWSHQWYVWDSPTYDGISFGKYSCSPELRGNFGSKLTNIGVICHELGHVFGAPDYYDTDYEGSGGQYYGLGNWDIMSSGSWNDNGRTPARHGAYTASYIYRWTDPMTLTDPQLVRIAQSGDRHDVFRVNTSTNGDYFLLENRQKKDFDKNVPGHGMLVYHVHPSANGSNVDNHQHPQQLYIMPAYCQIATPDASPSSYCDPNSNSTPFPGQSHHDSLTDNSQAWFRPWSGAENHTPLYNIQENLGDSSIYFFFKSVSPIEPISLHAHYSSEYVVDVEWQVYGTTPALVLLSRDGLFTTPDTIYTTGDTITDSNIVFFAGNTLAHKQFVLDSAEVPDTLYFKLFCLLEDSTYSSGIVSYAIPYEYDTIPDVSIITPNTSNGPLVSVYPNPADNHVTVNLKSQGQAYMTMTDITGKTLLRKALHQGENMIDTSKYPKGAYILTIADGNGRTTQKLLISSKH